MTQFGISIGNFPVLIETSDTGIADFVRQNFWGFMVSDICSQSGYAGLWRVILKLNKKPKARSSAGSTYAINFSQTNGHIHLSRDDFSATIYLAKKTCDVNLTLPELIDVFLRVFYSAAGVYDHSILLHAAGLKYQGMAHLFVAPPMGGKTTIVKNAQADDVLSDELVLLSKHNGCWQAYSTPFGGSFPAKASFSAQVSAIWFLQKSKDWVVSEIGPADSARQLLKNALFFSRNVRDHYHILELISDLATNVPAKQLKFAINTEVTKCIDTLKK